MKTETSVAGANGLKRVVRRSATGCVLRLLPLLLVLVSATAQAEDYTWSDNGDGTCTITEYIGPGGAVTIPSSITWLTVTIIGNDAFRDNGSLTSVTIPDTVITIGDRAFWNCTNLPTPVFFGLHSRLNVARG